MNAGQNQEFCVRWNSHLGSIGAAFPQLLAGQRFVDVTLACEGHQVHCHRLVLAACSSYFEAILAENPCKHPVIILPSEIKLWEIQALVDFMYKGEVNVTQAGLPQLLRCAEQLRIRGLHGSDAALNLNQLKALTNKAAAAAALAAVVSENTTETESTNDTCTSINTPIATAAAATTTATAAVTTTCPAVAAVPISATTPTAIFTPNMQSSSNKNLLAQEIEQQYVKKEINNFQSQVKQERQSNGRTVSFNQRQLEQSQYQQQQRREFKQESQVSNFSSADDNDDDDESGAENSSAVAFTKIEEFTAVTHDTSGIIDDDHSYVASSSVHEDESYLTNMPDGDAEMSGHNLSGLNTSIDGSGSFKRVRRSEASLAQAAKCVSKGETFQTVSNMFNIPVSTIRFYMARKGILPKRKRGRGASSNSMGGSISAGTLADIKQQQIQLQQEQQQQQRLDLDEPFHLMAGYQLKSEQEVSII